MSQPIVSVIMGSQSDFSIIRAATDVLRQFSIPFETKVISAHRTPRQMVDYADKCLARGIKVIIAGAGGAAHLPGMVASLTPLPVIGVPVELKCLDGMDSLLSIVQMPKGVPVATVAINNSTNAALLAVRILAVSDAKLTDQLIEFSKLQEKKVAEMNRSDDFD